MKHADLARASRIVPVAHGEAFQLMLYKAQGKPDRWIWNSRDGVTPFGLSDDYVHAMNQYRPTYSAILPDEATHVFADYDRNAWEEMERAVYDRYASEADGPYGGAVFREQYPTIDDWLRITPFQHGQPRVMTREEWLGWTSSYAAKMAA